MRQVALGAVVAFVVTVIILSVWQPKAPEVTPPAAVAPVRMVPPPPARPLVVEEGVQPTQKLALPMMQMRRGDLPMTKRAMMSLDAGAQ